MRRSFFVYSLTLLLVCVLMMQPGCVTAPQKLDQIGLQLWSVRHAMQEDFKGTLIRAADAGYDQIEFAGYYGQDPQKIRILLDSLGLTAPANHTGYDLLTGENLERTIEAARIIGHEYLVMPSLPPVRLPEPREAGQRWKRPDYTIEEVRQIADIFNELGRTCREAGLKFAYHNHSFEFDPIDSTGPVMYDVLLQETDPALVDFELDIGWAAAAGADPLAYFEKYPGRFKLFHVKDMDEDNHSVVIGEGTIDFARIFDHAGLAGAMYYIVEYEGRKDPISSVAESASYLKDLRF